MTNYNIENNKFDENEKISVIKLAYCRGVGYRTVMNFLNRCSFNATETVKAIKFHERGAVFLSDDEIRKEIEKNEKLKIKIVTFKDAEYSELLRNAQDSFPLALHCKGNTGLLRKENSLAIVGSRKTSINIINFTKKVAGELAGYGYTIVSGMARGIDAAAHNGSLKTGTVAVLGGDVNHIYPMENRKLYYDIIDNGGLIISELRTGTSPMQADFLNRNRIVAGLSVGVVVAAAGVNSGTSRTVRYTIQFNRDVMVFPGNPYDENNMGSNEFLKQDARLVTSSADIIEYIGIFPYKNTAQFSDHVAKEKTWKEMNIFEEEKENENYEDIILAKLDYTPIALETFINNCKNDEKLKNFKDNFNALITKWDLNGKITLFGGKICLKLK
jgi:DNA processing protein